LAHGELEAGGKAAGTCGDRGQGIAYEQLIAGAKREEAEREQADAERRELAD